MSSLPAKRWRRASSPDTASVACGSSVAASKHMRGVWDSGASIQTSETRKLLEQVVEATSGRQHADLDGVPLCRYAIPMTFSVRRSAALPMMIGLSLALIMPAWAQDQRPRTLSDDQRASCLADGGQIKIMGFSGIEGCVRPMPDAGHVCTDGSQCRSGSCVLDDRKPNFKPPKMNAKVKGICAATDSRYGCAWHVLKGRSIGGMCAD